MFLDVSRNDDDDEAEKVDARKYNETPWCKFIEFNRNLS